MKFWQSTSDNVTDVPHRPGKITEISSIKAAVCSGRGKAKHCIIANLNLSGMFLEMPNADFPVGAELEVLFFCDLHGSTKRCSEIVRVVQSDEQGVAVAFTRYDNQHQCNIQNMLHKMHQIPHIPPASHGTIRSEHLNVSRA